jgi:ABC-type branched-subunit amino acid transport system substrate-binding protein
MRRSAPSCMRYRAAYHTRPNNFASFAWDAAHLAARALAQDRRPRRRRCALAAALIALPPYHGSTGTFRFTESDHNGMHPDDIHIAVDRNARLVHAF